MCTICLHYIFKTNRVDCFHFYEELWKKLLKRKHIEMIHIFYIYLRKEENFYFFNGVLFYYEFFINSFQLKHSFTLYYNLCLFYKINYDVQCDNDVT